MGHFGPLRKKNHFQRNRRSYCIKNKTGPRKWTQSHLLFRLNSGGYLFNKYFKKEKETKLGKFLRTNLNQYLRLFQAILIFGTTILSLHMSKFGLLEPIFHQALNKPRKFLIGWEKDLQKALKTQTQLE